MWRGIAWLMVIAFLAGCADAGGSGEGGGSDGTATNSGTGLNQDTNNDSSGLNDGTNLNDGTGNDDGTEPAPLEGIYDVEGSDSHGSYTGEAEIRSDGNELRVIEAVTWDSYTFEGRKVAWVWEGTLDGSTITVRLRTRRFVKSYGGETRDTSQPAEVICSGTITRTAPDTLAVSFDCPAPAQPFTQTWKWREANGTEPIWENERVEIPSHDPMPPDTKQEWFATYSSYHQREDVQPYTSRQEFQDAMHYWIVDPTDYWYYQDHPDAVRVIQGVVDPISLREALQRALAYSTDLHEKEAIYEAEAQQYYIDTLGMFSDYDPNNTEHPYRASGDGMLWTGVYVASQAMRYLVTGSQEALQNMLRSLDGQILCWEIMPGPGEFARTVRVHELIVPGSKWVQGDPPYDAYDYLPGANNDMLKGYLVGFLWGYRVLSQVGGYDAYIDKMKEILLDLVENFDVAKDHRLNETYIYMMLAMMEDDILDRAEYVAHYQGLWQVVKEWINGGSGARYEYGISDWSGTHLNLQTLLGLWLLTDALGEGDMHADVEDGMKRALENMRHTRIGLFQLVMAALGDHGGTTPPELDEALWRLQEFPAPKATPFDVDWRIDPEFCLSPWPSLPWKGDWLENDRTQSIRAYPLFEQTPSGFWFKDNPFRYKGNETRMVGGIDYLFAYWFARYFGVLTM